MDKLYGECLFGERKQEDSTKCSASTSRLTKLSTPRSTHSHLRLSFLPSPAPSPPLSTPAHTPPLSRYRPSQQEVYNAYYPPPEPTHARRGGRERRWELERVIRY